jgi:peptidoglycan hydrolase-like protein with peptidoglycan-binding domain
MKKLLLLGILSLTIAPYAPLEAAPKQRVAAVVKWPTFRPGDSLNSVWQVKAIQYLLRSRGVYKSRIDGVFGARTTAAVRAFQHKNGLKADGIVGSRTLPLLIKTVKRGNKGDAVRAVQHILKYGFAESETLTLPPLTVDGVFGFQTERAVRAFQKDYALKSDGIVGAKSWSYLFEASPMSRAF